MPVPLLGQAIRHRHSAVDEERGGRVHRTTYIIASKHNLAMWKVVPVKYLLILCHMDTLNHRLVL